MALTQRKRRLRLRKKRKYRKQVIREITCKLAGHDPVRVAEDVAWHPFRLTHECVRCGLMMTTQEAQS